MTTENELLTVSVKKSLRSLKRVQKLQPKMKLQPLIDQTELLVDEMENPKATAESIKAIQDEIERIKTENRWH